MTPADREALKGLVQQAYREGAYDALNPPWVGWERSHSRQQLAALLDAAEPPSELPALGRTCSDAGEAGQGRITERLPSDSVPADHRRLVAHVSEVLTELGLTADATVASIQSALGVSIPNAMRLLAVRAAIAALTPSGSLAPNDWRTTPIYPDMEEGGEAPPVDHCCDACGKGWPTVEESAECCIGIYTEKRGPRTGAGWQPVATKHPKPHARYLVRRDGIQFTATPCYGMHQPWWVVKTMEGEAPPVPFEDTDEWLPAPPPQRSNYENRLR